MKENSMKDNNNNLNNNDDDDDDINNINKKNVKKNNFNTYFNFINNTSKLVSKTESSLTHVNFKGINSFLKFDDIRHAIEDNIDSDADSHNENKTSSPHNLESQSVVIERQGGLANKFVLFLLALWYLFSALTLYTNKYIVATRKADSFILGK